jgi:hypothetical protein
MAAVLALGVAGPLAAQFSLTSSSGAKTTNTTNMTVPQTVNINQMLPKMNINSALIAPQGNSRQFDFSKLLPNFSFINNRWPIRIGQSQFPTQGKKK